MMLPRIILGILEKRGHNQVQWNTPSMKPYNRKNATATTTGQRLTYIIWIAISVVVENMTVATAKLAGSVSHLSACIDHAKTHP